MIGSISRTFTFCAAHRIEGHPKCGRMHGHNYVVTVSLEGQVNNSNGMVIDFGDVDAQVKPLIDAMDHRYLISNANLNAEDPYAEVAIEVGDDYHLNTLHSTAEFIAAHIHDRVCTKLHWTLDRCRVDVQETPRNTASFIYGG
jgi:6-pyruvoyl tetrahydropterin synthase/QueD family protein